MDMRVDDHDGPYTAARLPNSGIRLQATPPVFLPGRSHMIMMHAFPGDDDETLTQLQMEAYGPVISKWRRQALEFLSAAERVTGASDAGRILRSRRGFDHRSVQQIHDRIANLYRYLCMQPRLGDPPTESPPERARLWSVFAEQTFESLCESDPDFTSEYLRSMAFENSERGYEAEEQCALLLDRHVRMKFGIGFEGYATIELLETAARPPIDRASDL